MLDRSDGERPERRTALIAMELKRYNIDVAALSETRLAEQGKLREVGAGYTFYWVGHPADSARVHGVCFAVSDRINSMLVGEPVGINPRLMSMRLRLGRGKFASLISVYSPPLNHPDDEKDLFYSQLSATIGSMPACDRLFLMGDFNARVGSDNSIWPDVLGAHGIGRVNSNGERLLSLCATHALSITNTQFKLKENDVATWTHPRSGHQHLLDYVIVRQRDSKEVRITRVMRGAECNTDHKLVRTKVQILIRKPVRFHSGTTKRKYNLHRLNQGTIRALFQKNVSEKLNSSEISSNAQTMWQNLKSTLLNAAEVTIGQKKVKRTDWFDENNTLITEMVKLKNTAYEHVINDPTSRWNKSVFLRSRTLLTQSLRSLKNEWWIRQAEQMQTFVDRRQTKEFYDSLKTVFGPRFQSTATMTDSVTGVSCSQPSEVMEIWRDHFKNLLNRPCNIDWETVHSVTQQPIRSHMSDVPDLDEVRKALGQLRSGKAAGEDDIPAELLKHGGPSLENALLQMIKAIWDTEQVPKEFKDALIVPLYKGKGSKQCTNSYRGISLLSCAGKLLARVLLNRLNSEILETNVPEEQCGFRMERGTTDLIFAARQLQEKCRDHNQPLHALFIDFTKAFDSVDREVLWTVLSKFGCPGKFVNLIKCMHSGMKAKVKCPGANSDEFDIITGVKQGCVLAPTLFSLFLTAIITLSFSDSDSGIDIEYRMDGRLLNVHRFGAKSLVCDSTVRMLLFADDCALFAHTARDLQYLTDTFATKAAAFGLEINTSKTCSFFQPNLQGQDLPSPSISINNITIASCDNFCYLGSHLSTDLSINRELSSRVSKAACAFGRLEQRVWKNHSLKLSTKITVYRAMVLSTLLYGCETWTLYRRNIQYLDRFHLQCLRRILRIHWSHMIPNTEVLRRANVDGIEAMIMLSQLRWLGHVRRMDTIRTPKQLLYGQLRTGKRAVGQPKLRYQDQVKSTLKHCNIDLHVWEGVAADRRAWRTKIQSGVRHFERQRLLQCERKRAIRKAKMGTAQRDAAAALCCSACGRMCSSRSGLTRHQSTHNGLPNIR